MKSNIEEYLIEYKKYDDNLKRIGSENDQIKSNNDEIDNIQNDINNDIKEKNDNIKKIESENKSFKDEQKNYDITDKKLVVSNMEKMIKSEKTKAFKNIEKEVAALLKKISTKIDTIKDSMKICEQVFSRGAISKILNKNMKFEGDIKSLETLEIQGDGALKIIGKIQKIVHMVFGFGFIKEHRTIANILVFAIWWFIVCPLLGMGMFAGNAFIEITLLTNGPDPSTWGAVLAQTIFLLIKWVITLIFPIIIRAVCKALLKFFARKFLKENAKVCAAEHDMKSFMTKYKHELIDKRQENFMNTTFKQWVQDKEDYEDDKLSDSRKSDKDCFYYIVTKNMKEEFDKLEDKIKDNDKKINNENKQISLLKDTSVDKDGKIKAADDNNIDDRFNKISDIYKKNKEIEKKISDVKEANNAVAEVLKKKQTSLQNDNIDLKEEKYNDASITPYCYYKFFEPDENGVSRLLAVKHNYKPIFITYDSSTNHNKLVDEASNVVLQFVEAFLKENCYSNILFSCVDIETGGGVSAKAKDALNGGNIKSENDLNKFYDGLIAVRNEIVDKADNIIEYNKNRLESNNSAAKFNISFMFNPNLEGMKEEYAALFSITEKFGFLPLIIIDKNKFDDILGDDSGSRKFTKVIKVAEDNNTVLSMNELIG